MGAFVICDPYWDAVAAFDDEADAKAYVAGHDSTHYLWVADATVTDFHGVSTWPKPWEHDEWPPPPPAR